MTETGELGEMLHLWARLIRKAESQQALLAIADDMDEFAADALGAVSSSPSTPELGCPCHHTEPCHPRCTCVQPFSSHGCARCCRYGSPEQQKRKAERLASLSGEATPSAATHAQEAEEKVYHAYEAARRLAAKHLVDRADFNVVIDGLKAARRFIFNSYALPQQSEQNWAAANTKADPVSPSLDQEKK